MRPEYAIKDYQRAVDLEPTNARSRLLLGRQLLEMGRFEEAVRELEKGENVSRSKWNS
jgi:Flp pilus assembly protein TadD